MKITDVKAILLTGPSTLDPYLSECRKRRSAAFVEIHTDGGITGYGETYGGYFAPELIPPAVEFFKPVLLGRSPEDVSGLWDRMYYCENFWCRTGLGLMVINALEAALWDIKGKIHELPVYELLGGKKHDYLDCYATGGPCNYPLEKLQCKIEHYMSFGFKAVKVAAGAFYEDEGFIMPVEKSSIVDLECEKMEFINSSVGKQAKVAIDAHMNNNNFPKKWDLSVATAVAKALEQYDLMFLEEPLIYNDPWGYSQLCKNTTLTIAGGECLTGTAEWKTFIEKDCFDIGQLDASFMGGLEMFCDVANMLDAKGKKIATHAWGAGGSFMQNIHSAFACRNTAVLEIAPNFGPLHKEILIEEFKLHDGKVAAPKAPGLGIELTDSIKERYKFVPGSGEFNSVPGKILID